MSKKTYQVLGVLMRYPKQQWMSACDELYGILVDEGLLSSECLLGIKKLLQHFKETKLLTLEEEYVGVFDFRRQLSLHLFEHVHGDSRDRGQAMVDLVERYTEVGLKLDENELPDYLPIYLEYLSSLSGSDIENALGDIINIISVLKGRLKAHDNLYYYEIFNALESLSAIKPNKKVVDKALKGYKSKTKDYSELDKEWREPKAFSRDEQPIYFVRNPNRQTETEKKEG